MQLQALADVERRQAGVTDQIRGRRCTQQTETQALKLRVLAAVIVELPDACEELVRRKRQAAHGVYLVYEDHHTLPVTRQDDLLEGLHPSLHWTESGATVPEGFEFI